jgi:hypothetical protein
MINLGAMFSVTVAKIRKLFMSLSIVIANVKYEFCFNIANVQFEFCLNVANVQYELCLNIVNIKY